MMNRRASGLVKATATAGKHRAFRNAAYEWLKTQGREKTGREILDAFVTGQITARTGLPFSMRMVPRRANDVSQRLRRDSRFIKGEINGRRTTITWTVEA